ncbi:MAG: alanine--tRNA ligase, partial [bacterium]|nr:alanine--tRNA ligase [bacterium]
GHAIIPSASIVPENDPTTLFTGSGMQPLVPYLLGEPHPKGTRLADSQKCFRAEDIEEVGNNRHTTFFEMLGNWSLGDYFKKEQLPWLFEFLTVELKLDPKNLYVTVFDGSKENGIPRDEESIAIWKRLFAEKGLEAEFAAIGDEKSGSMRGIRGAERIFSYGSSNWWSRAGAPENMPKGEPGGPDSEVFYDFRTEHDERFGKHCHPNCDCGRFLEIGNSVFMEYIKTENGFEKLPKQNVDFGGGLERLTAAANGNPDVFKVDSLYTIIERLEKESGHAYDDAKYTAAFRIVADHMRGAVVMIGNGVLPGNAEQGYFVRRLIRRSVRYADMLGVREGSLAGIADILNDTYGEYYSEVSEHLQAVKDAVKSEEAKFRSTVARGMKELEKLLAKDPTISGRDAFILFTTYGFPVELTEEIAAEHGGTVERDIFKKEMERHQQLSRTGAEQKFKGGLADHSEKTTQLHTTHHLLLKALQIVLGGHVKQRGSNITGERLRIDFSHDEKLTNEQRAEVERIVNEKIEESLPVIKSALKKEEAEALGAEQEFGQKYPDIVSVYSVGPKGAAPENPKFDEAFSLEFCGGPHVANTADVKGTFRIAKEQASSSGVRRIRGVLE